MESHSQKIIKIIEDLVLVMGASDSSRVIYYREFFVFTLGQLNEPHDLGKVAENILKAFGGMGTLNDIAIFYEEKYLETEDDKFNALCDELMKNVKKL